MTDAPSDKPVPTPSRGPDETLVLPSEGPETLSDDLAQQPEPPADKRRRRWPLVSGLAALVLVGGAYVAGYVAAGDTVPRNATVSNIKLGGLTRATAIDAVKAGLADQAVAPLTLTVEAKSATITPESAGLSLDAEKTVDATGVGRSWSPVHIWRVLTGGGTVDPVPAVDQSALSAAVTTAAASLDTTPVDAGITYQGVEPVRTEAVDGVTVDQPGTAEEIVSSYLKQTTIAAKAAIAHPDITTAEADDALTKLAKPAVAAPVALDSGKGSFQVSPEAIASATTFVAKDGALTLNVDPAKLLSSATNAMAAVQLGAPVDAKIAIGADGKPAVTPSKDGLTITAEKLAAAVAPLLPKPAAERTGTVEATVAQAAFTTEAAQKLGVKEVTGEFTTYWPHAAYRNTNIGKAASTVNGTLLKPGETFSLNQILGPRTAERGYVDGYVIQGGALVKETGGGISQSATTFFNAAFFAGLKDVEHHPHMFYIDRYPAGREATVYYGSLDLRFSNDTDYGVLVQSFIKPSTSGSQGSITVRMWSTKTWDEVRSSELVKSNYTQPTTRTSTNPKCEPQGSNVGFDVNYSRLFVRGGQVAREEKFFVRYAPQDKIVCAPA